VGHRNEEVSGMFMPVYCIKYDRHDRYIITGGDDKLLKIWDADTGALQATLKAHRSEVSDLIVSPDNSFVISASTTGEVYVWQLDSASCLCEMHDQGSEITCMAWIENTGKKYLITCGKGGKCCLYKAKHFCNFHADQGAASPVELIYTPDVQPILAISTHPSGQYFATATGKGYLLVWSIDKIDESETRNHLMWVWRDITTDLNVLDWSPCGKYLITGGDDSNILLYNFDIAEATRFLQNNRQPLTGAFKINQKTERIRSYCDSCIWSLNSNYAIISIHSNPRGRPSSNSIEHAVKVWSMKKQAIQGMLGSECGVLHKNRVFVTKRHPTEERIIMTADYNGLIVIWDIERMVSLRSFQETGSLIFVPENSIPIVDGSFSSDGCSFVVSNSMGGFSIYNIGAREEVIASPVYQFFSTDYHESAQQYLCDMAERKYENQPPVTNFLFLNSFIKDNFAQRFEYGLHEDRRIAYLKEHASRLQPTLVIDDEETDIQQETPPSSSRRRRYRPSSSDDEHSPPERERLTRSRFRERIYATPEESSLLVDSNPYCTRCKGLLGDRITVCPDCRRCFHVSCLERLGMQSGTMVCLTCFKSQVRSVRELTYARRKQIDRSWLEIDQYSQFVYVPQVGDVVVYFLQGYEDYLKKYTGDPLIDPAALELISPVYMEVVEIEYNWPAIVQFTSNIQEHIQMILTLQTLGENSQIKVLYRLNDVLPEYLILKEIYDTKLHNLYSRIREGQIAYLKVDGQFERVIIRDISPKEEAFADSPWESVVVEFLEGSDSSQGVCTRHSRTQPRVSFWELDLQDNPCPVVLRNVAFDTDLKKKALKDVERIMETQQAEYFKYPIGQNELPNYFNVIKVQMNIDLIRRRIFNNYYRSSASIEQDISLVVENSREYNGEKSPATRDTEFLARRLRDMVKRYLNRSQPGLQIGINLPRPSSLLVGYTYPVNVQSCPPVVIQDAIDEPLTLEEPEERYCAISGRNKLRKLR
jgi:WD40 repeat protein